MPGTKRHEPPKLDWENCPVCGALMTKEVHTGKGKTTGTFTNYTCSADEPVPHSTAVITYAPAEVDTEST